MRLWIAGSEDTHLAYTFDVSNHGVKFGGCRGEFKVGDKIEVLYRHKHTQCRVAWITAPEGSSDKQIGAECLEPRKQVWVWSSPRKRMSTKKKIDGPYSETPRLLEKPTTYSRRKVIAVAGTALSSVRNQECGHVQIDFRVTLQLGLPAIFSHVTTGREIRNEDTE